MPWHYTVTLEPDDNGMVVAELPALPEVTTMARTGRTRSPMPSTRRSPSSPIAWRTARRFPMATPARTPDRR